MIFQPKVKYLFSSLLALMSLLSKAQIPLERKKVTDEISMKVPSNFISMTEGERNQRYISYRTPVAMYTNIERTVDLGINITGSTWETGDLKILKDFYKSNILSLYTEVDFIQEEIRNIGQKEYIVFEFQSRVYEENSFKNQVISKYTYIQYTLHQDKILLFHFTAPKQLRSKWQTSVAEMMESIRIKT